MKEVVAVIVTYNRKEKLGKCLECLKNLNGDGCDILIIDNGSSDGTDTLVQSYSDVEEILYKNTGENLGGAGGFSYGMKAAINLGYKYLWLMDDDTYVTENALQELIRCSEELNEQYGWLSSIALWKDDTPCVMNLQKVDLYKKIDSTSEGIQKAIMATFVSFFISAEVVKKFGLPIKDFFIWSDDFEYSRRISLKLPCYVVGSSRVVHDMENNTKVGIESDSEDRMWRYEYLYRNEVYIYRREGLKGWIYLTSRVGYHILKVLLKADKDKKKKIRLILRSFMSGLEFDPQIEYIA